MLIMALITFLLGLFFVIFPGTATITLCIILGWVLLVSGVCSIVFFIAAKNGRPGVALLIAGIIGIALGLWLVINPAFWIGFLFILIGLLVLYHGFSDIGDSIELKRCGYSQWWISLILAIITLILAVLIILAPFATAVTMVVICGIILMFDAVTDLFILINISKFLKDRN